MSEPVTNSTSSTKSPGKELVPLTLNQAKAQMTQMVMNVMTSRWQWMQQRMDGANRDLDKDCGYNSNPDVADYRIYYEKEGLAARAVNVLPDECWSLYPDMWEDDDEGTDTPFEAKWKEIQKKHKIWHYLHRIDRMSGIGRFGVLVIGFDDMRPGDNLEKPVPGIDLRTGEPDGMTQERNITFLRCFAEDDAQIAKLVTDETSPRYGLPELYRINFINPAAFAGTGLLSAADGTITQSVMVHWTRCLHVADNRSNAETHGTPRQQQIFNRLHDLRKLLGASAEMFWKGGFPGYSIEAMPDVIEDGDLDMDTVKDQLFKYMNGLQRYVGLTGMTMKSLAPQVSDPTAHILQQLIALCATIGVPLRIFLGSEAGHLASSQDSTTWNRRLGHRQEAYLTPMLIDPFVERLIAVGVLPRPAQWKIEWRDLNAMSDKDRADVAVKKAQAILQYVTSGAETIIPPLEFFTYVLEMPLEQAKQIMEAATKNASDPSTEDVWKKPDPAPLATSGDASKKTGASGKSNSQSGPPKKK